MKPKIIAMYLPQFHCIPENDEFWGKGFTDWVTVRKAKPLYKGHNQPKKPLAERYYDLSVKEDVAWHAKIAKQYGIYGFGIYHYWFNTEKNLLTKPAQIILENLDIDINYYFAWDNTSWIRSWSNVKEHGNAWAPAQDVMHNKKGAPTTLVKYEIGGETDWEKHFMYLLPYFRDCRYIKIGNKPMFTIFHYSSAISQMCELWEILARKYGFDGIYFLFRYDRKSDIPKNRNKFKYEPQFSGWRNMSYFQKGYLKLVRVLLKTNYKIFDYNVIWKRILKNAQKHSDSDIYHGAFVSYDDTPRRGEKGIVVRNATPEAFSFFLSKLIDISLSQNKEYIFLTAWNEWGEGAVLEPDTYYGYGFLESMKHVLTYYK